MSDEEIRELEREFKATGDRQVYRRLVAAKVRRGEFVIGYHSLHERRLVRPGGKKVDPRLGDYAARLSRRAKPWCSAHYPAISAWRNDPPPVVYFKAHDAWACDLCDKWIEKRCFDPRCERCVSRPPRPSEAGGEKIRWQDSGCE